MSTESTAKKDIQKLQRAIVEGLEDVKAQDIQVFNTEHLSPLFERVVIASGTSNRQTKALAASVRDAVREAGFAKPRTEGEDNGEWIIVDCGQAVVHVMQPSIRQYYHLEDLWGEKPVRLKFGAPKPLPTASAPSGKSAQSTVGKTSGGSLRRSSAAKKGAAEMADASARKPAARKPRATSAGKAPAPSARSASPGKAPAKTSAPKKRTSPKAPAQVLKVNAPKPAAKPAAKKTAAKPKSPTAKKAGPRARAS